VLTLFLSLIEERVQSSDSDSDSTKYKGFAAIMSPKYIKRVTLFKVPKEEDIDAILAEYQVMRSTAQKVCFAPVQVRSLHLYFQ